MSDQANQAGGADAESSVGTTLTLALDGAEYASARHCANELGVTLQDVLRSAPSALALSNQRRYRLEEQVRKLNRLVDQLDSCARYIGGDHDAIALIAKFGEAAMVSEPSFVGGFTGDGLTPKAEIAKLREQNLRLLERNSGTALRCDELEAENARLREELDSERNFRQGQQSEADRLLAQAHGWRREVEKLLARAVGLLRICGEEFDDMEPDIRVYKDGRRDSYPIHHSTVDDIRALLAECESSTAPTPATEPQSVAETKWSGLGSDFHCPPGTGQEAQIQRS